MPASGTCDNDQKLPISFSYTTQSGRPASVQGETVVLVQFGDGTFERTGAHTGFLVSGDLPGDTEYVHAADADLGEGVVPIADTILLTVTGANAASVGVSLGTPVPK